MAAGLDHCDGIGRELSIENHDCSRCFLSFGYTDHWITSHYQQVHSGVQLCHRLNCAFSEPWCRNDDVVPKQVPVIGVCVAEIAGGGRISWNLKCIPLTEVKREQ
jgi:hypothetical protein